MDAFYADLSSFTDFTLVTSSELYSEIPSSWHVIITDVQGSTKAIEAGRYKEVNVLGAASIVAALNAVHRAQIPYVFGGDGATFVVPPSERVAVTESLVALAGYAEEAFSLGLRVGVVPVSKLHELGHSVQVAKFRPSPGVEFAMFNGGGLGIADALIKAPETAELYAVANSIRMKSSKPMAPNLDGLQCRWNPIPSRNGNMLSLLVTARAEDAETRDATYRRVVEYVDSIESPERLKPVHQSTMSLASDIDAFDEEAKIKAGKRGGTTLKIRRAAIKAQTSVGNQILQRGLSAGGFDGQSYVKDVVSNTDFRKFDDCLRMVLDAPPEFERLLRERLEKEFKAGAIAYGIHTSPSALMTCMVFQRGVEHVHFVDGGDGGYALAAKGMKAQLKL